LCIASIGNDRFGSSADIEALHSGRLVMIRKRTPTLVRAIVGLGPKAKIVGAMAGDADAIADWQCG
jgi:hypothetical protein